MFGIDLTDTDVITVLYQHFGQGKRQTEYRVDIALQEQHATLLIGHRSAIRQLWSSAEAIQHWLFVIVTWDTFLLTEYARPFISTLIVDTVETFVQDRFDNATKVGTSHWGCHNSVPPLNSVNRSNVLTESNLYSHNRKGIAPIIIRVRSNVDDAQLIGTTRTRASCVHSCRRQAS